MARKVKNEPSAEVQELYDAFPRHEAKQDALKALAEALDEKHVPFDTIMAGIVRYKQAMTGVEMRFVKLCGGWIRKARWTDEFDAMVSAPAQGAVRLSPLDDLIGKLRDKDNALPMLVQSAENLFGQHLRSAESHRKGDSDNVLLTMIDRMQSGGWPMPQWLKDLWASRRRKGGG